MTRDELIARTRQLMAEGDRLQAAPSLGALQLWLQLSDDLLRSAWGSMDRFHMAWLSVGRPHDIVRGRPMTPAEESDYVRDVAAAKNAVLRASLDAAVRGLPFVGESGGVGAGTGVPTAAASDTSQSGRSRPDLASMTREVAEARRRAEAHHDHQGPRAPRPEKLQR
jgi:hypothetical protein